MKLATYTGRLVEIPRIELADICIEDIAHHLAHLCRFNGACRQFYSVAQHSLLVSREVQRQMEGGAAAIVAAMHGLLHDAAEAYIGDVTRPAQRAGLGDAWGKLEAEVSERIFAWAQVERGHGPEVGQADNRLLATEIRDLMVQPPFPEWDGPLAQLPESLVSRIEPLAARIEPWGPEKAKEAFLWRWWTLRELRDREAPETRIAGAALRVAAAAGEGKG